jgi:hypothetical protein
MNEREIPKFHDITLYCEDCHSDFIFTVGEQEFFFSKGLTEPKRCKPCRKFRKLTISPDNGYAREVSDGK